MLNFKSMRKSKLALALSAAVMAGTLAAPSAQAVQLAQDGLGGAVIYPYFTAKGNWQTFIRLINTSNQAVVVKVRFREAANSRELRDFLVALSPRDMWSAWTDASALNGQPGIRTNDTSCIFDLPNTGPSTFQTISGPLKGLAFTDAAFAGDYHDRSAASSVDRMSEGYIEVIGVASFAPNSELGQAVTHNQTTGYPTNCSIAQDLYRNIGLATVSGPVGNVLAANAQLINVSAGEGIGYDPVVLANFQDDSLRLESLVSLVNNTGGVGHGQWPTLDSADPVSLVLTDDGILHASTWDTNQTGDSFFNSNTVAASQLLANGTVAQIVRNAADLNNDGDAQDLGFTIINPDGTTLATGVDENNLPGAVVTALTGRRILTAGTNVTIVNTSVANSFPFNVIQTATNATAASPARLTNIAHDNVAGTAVRGGIDAVSAVLARQSVINEWAASPTPAGVVKDYYTQWVLTFPTKHYYVDLQDDPDLTDRYAPTLVDPRGDAAPDLNDAFAPFSNEFNRTGTSCEAYAMDLWDREESYLGFTSPAGAPTTRMCNEVNVLSFTDTYATRGINSSFGAVVPADLLPPNAMMTPFTRAQRGWARLTFTGVGATTGLLARTVTTTPFPALNGALNTLLPVAGAPAVASYSGLPVVGFSIANYNTGSAMNNHNAANAHKYTRAIANTARAVPAPGAIIP